MAKVAYKIIKVTFDELKQLFIKHCEKLGLFEGHRGFPVFVNIFVSLFMWYNFCSTAIDGKCLQIISIIHSPEGD